MVLLTRQKLVKRVRGGTILGSNRRVVHMPIPLAAMPKYGSFTGSPIRVGAGIFDIFKSIGRFLLPMAKPLVQKIIPVATTMLTQGPRAALPALKTVAKDVINQGVSTATKAIANKIAEKVPEAKPLADAAANLASSAASAAAAKAIGSGSYLHQGSGSYLHGSGSYLHQGSKEKLSSGNKKKLKQLIKGSGLAVAY